MSRLRLTIVVALEALEAGDVRLAVDVLLDALEGRHRGPRFACDCGQVFEWPGLREAHRDQGGCSHLQRAA